MSGLDRFGRVVPRLGAAEAAAVVGAASYGLAAAPSESHISGPTPWARFWGPNELAALNKSPELAATAKLVTCQQAANGPAMFRREGASVFIDAGLMPVGYGNINTTAAGIAAGAWANKTVMLSVYWHRLNAGSKVVLRVGANTGNYVRYIWQAAANMLAEGWNTLLVHTGEPIGVGSSPYGQLAFQSGFTVTDGWVVGAGTFSFATDPIGYIAIEVDGVKAAIHNSFVWIEGVYIGGRETPKLTIGFDIQTAGLDLAKSTMDKYGFRGYAAVPTSNGNPATPQFLWEASDVARLQSLNNAGWDVIQHTVSHNSLGNYSDDSMIYAEFEGCEDQIKQIGCSRAADLCVLSNNSTSNRVVSIAARAGVRWMRGKGQIMRASGAFRDANPLLQGCISIENQPNSTMFERFIDLLIQYGASGHVYTHAIREAPTVLDTSRAVFDSMLAYARSRVDAGLLEVVTPFEFIRQQAWPRISSCLRLPNRLAITPLASPYSHINAGYEPYVLTISGGTVSAIDTSRDGSVFDATGETSGQFIVSPGDRVRITYSVAPTIIQQRIST